MSYFSKFEQNIKESSVNSSTDDLAAGDTFTGTADSTYGVAAIQIAFYANQNCMIYVDQSTDDAPVAGAPHWDITDSYNYYAGGTFGITVQAISAYVRVRVTNLNSVTGTSGLRLLTTLCPIVEAIPRSLDEFGHLQVGVKSNQDLFGMHTINTQQGEMRSVVPIRLVGANFEGTTVDPNFWTVTNTNGGTTTQAGSIATLATNTTANGSTVLASFRRARYVSGSSLTYRSVISVSAGATNNKRRWGVAYGASMPTITDYVLFQLNGTVFSIVVGKNGVAETEVLSGAFNGQYGLTYILDTNLHTYELLWSGTKCYCVIDGIVLHTFTSTSTALTSTQSHFIFHSNVNSSGATSNNALVVRTSSIRRLGPLQSQLTSKYIVGAQSLQLKYGPGNLIAVVMNKISGTTISLYDNVSAASGTIGIVAPGGTPGSVDYHGIPFFNGLYVVTVGASIDCTIIYE